MMKTFSDIEWISDMYSEFVHQFERSCSEEDIRTFEEEWDPPMSMVYEEDLDGILTYLLFKATMPDYTGDVTVSNPILESILNECDDKERTEQMKTLLKRFEVIEKGFEKNSFNEDYYLKTVYGLIRHLYHFVFENRSGLLRDEVIMLYKLLEHIAKQKIMDRTGTYGRCAKGCMEQLNFDMVKYVSHRFRKGGWYKYDVYIGYGLHAPGGCSPLCTSIASYDGFRGGSSDLDYWYVYDSDENDTYVDMERNVVQTPDFEDYSPSDRDNIVIARFPSFDEDENDDEILKMFPELMDDEIV